MPETLLKNSLTVAVTPLGSSFRRVLPTSKNTKNGKLAYVKQEKPHGAAFYCHPARLDYIRIC